MKSFWKSRSCLFAVALAAGGVGSFLGLQAALADGPPMVTSAITVQAPDFTAFVQIAENGDGTAFVFVNAPIDDCRFLGAADFANTTFMISTDFPPGQSGHGSISGTAHFTMEDAFVFDTCTFEFLFVDVSVDLAVADTTDFGQFVRQGIFATTIPFTSEVRIFREHIIGNQASGSTAGSLSIFVEGDPIADTTGGFGSVTANIVHNVEIIH